MGTTFTQAKDRTASAAHTVAEGAAAVRERVGRLTRHASGGTGTALARAQQEAAATVHTVKDTAAEAGVRTRDAVGTLTDRVSRTLPSGGRDMSASTKTLIGLCTAAVVALAAWLGLRGRVD